MKVNPLLLTDFYKQTHYRMYLENMTKLYSNFTPRKSRIEGIDSIVVFGLQYFIKEYLISQFNENFFNRDKKEVLNEYSRIIDFTLGKNQITLEHIEKLHDLGYLPLKIKSLKEGTISPIGVPVFTVTNTHKDFGWLVNFIETIASTSIWTTMTSATIAHQYKKLVDKYGIETVGNTDFSDFQCHDFSMRGMSSLESGCISGSGHLTSFKGTDTIPAILFLEKYYNANVEKELVGTSVNASEHSIMCVGRKENELETYERLLTEFPNGILSLVSDTWDLWKVITEILPKLKDLILSRDGKLVIRPDSGNPVDIVCGLDYQEIFDHNDYNEKSEYVKFENEFYKPVYDKIEDEWIFNLLEKQPSEFEVKGVIELLWDIFSGTINQYGYKILDSHIGTIYGDSITLDRAKQILERLKQKGFASVNVVLGVGSYAYQMNTRDTFGFAMKATYCELEENNKIVNREIFKDPITDDGTKRSLKGLIRVDFDENNKIKAFDQQTKEQENLGLLETIFENGILIVDNSLEEIRNRIKN